MAGKREDANLIVELAKWGSMIGLPEASRTIFSDDFDRSPRRRSTPTSRRSWCSTRRWARSSRTICSTASWCSTGSGSQAPGTGSATAALEARAAAGVPQLWENFEALAQSQG